jgi:hypothetical protein
MDPKFFRKYADIITEAEQIVEYDLNTGNNVNNILELNLFRDMLDPEAIEYDRDPKDAAKWKQLEAKWKPIAEQLANIVKELAVDGKTLNQEEVRSINNTFYEGSDAYDSRLMLTELPKIYDKQATTVKFVLLPSDEFYTAESTDPLFHDWMNSEHAPFDSDAGDDKTVTQKAQRYLHGKMHPKKVEKLATHLSKKFHGK